MHSGNIQTIVSEQQLRVPIRQFVKPPLCRLLCVRRSVAQHQPIPRQRVVSKALRKAAGPIDCETFILKSHHQLEQRVSFIRICAQMSIACKFTRKLHHAWVQSQLQAVSWRFLQRHTAYLCGWVKVKKPLFNRRPSLLSIALQHPFRVQKERALVVPQRCEL